MAQDHIFFLGKVFSDKKFADDFLNYGKFMCNTLNYFKGYKEELNNNIGDVYEGIGKRITPESGAKIKVADEEIHYKDVHIHSNKHLEANAFCMYGPNVPSEKNVTIEEVKDLIAIQEAAENLGEYFVIIHNAREFINRLKNYLDNSNYTYRLHSVNYKDLSGDFTISYNEIGFVKDNKYSHQKEFRLLIDRDNPEFNPLFLEIGSITDIAGIIPTKDFNSCFEVKLLEENRV